MKRLGMILRIIGFLTVSALCAERTAGVLPAAETQRISPQSSASEQHRRFVPCQISKKKSD